MDQQNINNQNGDSLRADESVIMGDSEKIKKFFRALAVLVVFFSSLSVPLYISYKTQENAKQMRIKMDMSQLKNWAEIYEVNSGNYFGLDNDSNVDGVFKDIESMGGSAHIIVSSDSIKYCCQTRFIKKELGTWCVDSSGYMGKDGGCDINNISCK
jgi:hypothetical protein